MAVLRDLTKITVADLFSEMLGAGAVVNVNYGTTADGEPALYLCAVGPLALRIRELLSEPLPETDRIIHIRFGEETEP